MSSLNFTNLITVNLPPPEAAVSRADRKKRRSEQKTNLEEILVVEKKRDNDMEKETSSLNKEIEINISEINNKNSQTESGIDSVLQQNKKLHMENEKLKEWNDMNGKAIDKYIFNRSRFLDDGVRVAYDNRLPDYNPLLALPEFVTF